MFERLFLILTLAHGVHAASINLPNPGFETSQGGRAGSWGMFEYGEDGADSRLKISREARSGASAIEIDVRGGSGGQGMYADVPVSGLQAGDVVTFSVHMKSRTGKPLVGGFIGLHVEFMSAVGDRGKILGRTDSLGSSVAVGSSLTKNYRRFETVHTINKGDVAAGLASVKALRFVIVAVQPADRKVDEKLGSVVIDDAAARLKR